MTWPSLKFTACRPTPLSKVSRMDMLVACVGTPKQRRTSLCKSRREELSTRPVNGISRPDMRRTVINECFFSSKILRLRVAIRAASSANICLSNFRCCLRASCVPMNRYTHSSTALAIAMFDASGLGILLLTSLCGIEIWEQGESGHIHVMPPWLSQNGYEIEYKYVLSLVVAAVVGTVIIIAVAASHAAEVAVISSRCRHKSGVSSEGS